LVSDPAAESGESGESRRARQAGGRPRQRIANRLHAGVLALVLLSTAAAQAAEIKVAVSANFAAPLRKIGVDFEKESGHRIVASVGSTGMFYAQIKAGAPFDALLAADDETPARLEKEGAGVAGSRFTYAIGKLVLWSRTPGFVDDRGEVLRTKAFSHLALADPRLAPYGAASLQVLKALGLLETLQPRFVTAANNTQAYQFVASGNAELGFLALSQVYQDGRITEGSGWIVPQEFYSPLRQDAVLLARARGKPAAEALLKYLRGDKARAIIRSYGYGL